MASRLKKVLEYWEATAGTYEKLVPPKAKPEAIIFQYEAKKAITTPAENNTLVTPELINERAYILASDINLPTEWAEAVVKLHSINRPRNIPQGSWLEIQEACAKFYCDDFGLLKLIINHEWSLSDIFGCHSVAPMTRFDMMGLLLLLHTGDEIVGVNKQQIKILRKTGSMNVFSKSLSSAEGVLLHELLAD